MPEIKVRSPKAKKQKTHETSKKLSSTMEVPQLDKASMLMIPTMATMETHHQSSKVRTSTKTTRRMAAIRMSTMETKQLAVLQSRNSTLMEIRKIRVSVIQERRI